MRRFCCFLSATLMMAALANYAAAQDAKKPNVVFVLIDDMGYADLGCMGGKDAKTPNIDRLAKEGVKLSQFYSNAPVCTPTRAAFITGRYQQRTGLEWALGFTAEQSKREGGKWVPEPDKLAPGLAPRGNSIAQLLHLLGYRCGIFGKWHLGYHPRFNPTRHGFHEYFGVLLGHADYYTYKYFDGTYCLREGDEPVKAKGYLTDLINERSVNFIKNNAGQRPFFLYVPHLALHFPFQAPDDPTQVLTKENHNKGTREAYVAMLERVDRGVGEMIVALQKAGVADNTLFIVSSDNGGYYLSDNAPLFHHKSTLWEGGVRVPCIMRWPDRLPKGKTSSQVGITMDLTATILAAAGRTKGDDLQLDGIDLMPILTGKQKEADRTLFWRIDRTGRKQKSVRDGNWKYLKDDNIELLFDLDKDVSQRTNLAYRHPAVVERLRRAVEVWEADMDKGDREFLVK
jgi:arylsulfatase A-like enzyme